LTRKKHDAGDVSDLVEHALEALGRTIEDVDVVVQVSGEPSSSSSSYIHTTDDDGV